MKNLIIIGIIISLIIISGCEDYKPVDFPKDEKQPEKEESNSVLNTFEEVFKEVEKIPVSSLDFIEISRNFTLKGKIIKETREAEIDCLTEPCDVESEEYYIYLFQDIDNKNLKIQVENKYIDQLSLKIGNIYIIKGKVFYLRTPRDITVRRFEPVKIL